MKKLAVLVVLMMVSTSFAGFTTISILDDGVAWTSGDVQAGSIITYSLARSSTLAAMGQFVNATLNVSSGTLGSAVLSGSYLEGTKSLTTPVAGSGFNVVMNGNQAGTSGIVAKGETFLTLTFTAKQGPLVIDAVSGNWFSTSVTAAPGATEIGGNLPYTAMNVVPEPVTVALLGLGGLFIRRRKVA